MWLDDGAIVTCEGCDEDIADDDCYYEVSGEQYCSSCFERYFKE
jgi:hypothetical protein